jgi:hypothetical protein
MSKHYPKIVIALVALLSVPTFITATHDRAYNPSPYTGGRTHYENTGLTFDECRVPVYHTNFLFPPQGGVIIDTGNGMFFVRTYLPGCENAADGYPVIKGAATAHPPTPHPTPQPTPPPPRCVYQ